MRLEQNDRSAVTLDVPQPASTPRTVPCCATE
jgi:hypothetical protein